MVYTKNTRGLLSLSSSASSYAPYRPDPCHRPFCCCSCPTECCRCCVNSMINDHTFTVLKKICRKIIKDYNRSQFREKYTVFDGGNSINVRIHRAGEMSDARMCVSEYPLTDGRAKPHIDGIGALGIRGKSPTPGKELIRGVVPRIKGRYDEYDDGGDATASRAFRDKTRRNQVKSDTALMKGEKVKGKGKDKGVDDDEYIQGKGDKLKRRSSVDSSKQKRRSSEEIRGHKRKSGEEDEDSSRKTGKRKQKGKGKKDEEEYSEEDIPRKGGKKKGKGKTDDEDEDTPKRGKQKAGKRKSDEDEVDFKRGMKKGGQRKSGYEDDDDDDARIRKSRENKQKGKNKSYEDEDESPRQRGSVKGKGRVKDSPGERSSSEKDRSRSADDEIPRKSKKGKRRDKRKFTGDETPRDRGSLEKAKGKGKYADEDQRARGSADKARGKGKKVDEETVSGKRRKSDERGKSANPTIEDKKRHKVEVHRLSESPSKRDRGKRFEENDERSRREGRRSQDRVEMEAGAKGKKRTSKGGKPRDDSKKSKRGDDFPVISDLRAKVRRGYDITPASSKRLPGLSLSLGPKQDRRRIMTASEERYEKTRCGRADEMLDKRKRGRLKADKFGKKAFAPPKRLSDKGHRRHKGFSLTTRIDLAKPCDFLRASMEQRELCDMRCPHESHRTFGYDDGFCSQTFSPCSTMYGNMCHPNYH